MAELHPCSFEVLARRMFRELELKRAIFDLPADRFFLGDPAKDLSVRFHDRLASSPFGPAAGPHTQMAQNIVLAWLGGARIFELKTVQVLDCLTIPRPCIDMRTIGYNVEWSQELTLEDALEEYVKASMLIEMLAASGRLEIAPGFERSIFDISVGYDLAGIRSTRVQSFIRAMQDARETVERLRGRIPKELRWLRDLDFTARIATSVTLSTFHGCPPNEVEQIVETLMEQGLDCTIKLNPTLLGRARTMELLHGAMGYRDVRVPADAFERDMRWDQMVEAVDRLGETAERMHRSLGVKFSNTLIVENPGDFLPASERVAYLSGPPLHVLAMELVRLFRGQFGDRFPISFSGGVDRGNFPDAVALDLVPVTVCTDLLKPGGYGRARGYFRELTRRMDRAGAASIGDFVLRAYGAGLRALDRIGVSPSSAPRERCEQAWAGLGNLRDASGDERLYRRWVAATAQLNTELYVEGLAQARGYTRQSNTKLPPRRDSHLQLFDCLTCDKCIPVCPNDANFRLVLPGLEIPVFRLLPAPTGWIGARHDTLRTEQDHQIGNFADLCNECGNCDTFCPEHGGPYRIKPRFFGSLLAWRTKPDGDGFYAEGQPEAGRIWGRLDGVEYLVEVEAGKAAFSSAEFAVTFDESDPLGTVAGDAKVEVDLRTYHVLRTLLRAVLDPSDVNYLNSA